MSFGAIQLTQKHEPADNNQKYITKVTSDSHESRKDQNNELMEAPKEDKVKASKEETQNIFYRKEKKMPSYKTMPQIPPPESHKKGLGVPNIRDMQTAPAREDATVLKNTLWETALLGSEPNQEDEDLKNLNTGSGLINLDLDDDTNSCWKDLTNFQEPQLNLRLNTKHFDRAERRPQAILSPDDDLNDQT